MQTIIIITLVMAQINAMTRTLPVNKVKFNPIPKEQLDPKDFVAQIAKETTTPRTEALHEDPVKPCPGSNLRGKLLYAPKLPIKDETQDKSQETTSSEESKNFISLPIISQPYENYKILIATAPPQLRLNGEKGEPTVIYIVFTEDDSRAAKAPNIPSIYFVNKQDGMLALTKKEKASPIFIVDNNRTVTGIRSKQIAKYVSFKRKFD